MANKLEIITQSLVNGRLGSLIVPDSVIAYPLDIDPPNKINKMNRTQAGKILLEGGALVFITGVGIMALILLTGIG